MFNIKTSRLFFVLWLFFVFPALYCASLFAEEETKETVAQHSNDNMYSPLVAMTSSDYVVTEGDVYSLIFFANGQVVNYQAVIDSAYRLKIANIATLNVQGKTFAELKQDVEKIVSWNYPLSGAQFTMHTPSVFKVLVLGEVTETKERTAWALTRLSDVLDGNLTDFSSKRFVTVIDKNGEKKDYDLFQATRFGDLTQNPYVRPGDKIEVKKIARSVKISGAIFRPGIYELSTEENLKELVNYYGDGLTDFSDTSRMKVTRYNIENNIYKEIYISGDSIKKNYPLQNHDSVYIYSVDDLQPVFFIEGALADTDLSSKKTVHFREGTNYASYFRDNKAIFSPYADLENAYIIRGNKKISIDIFSYLIDISKPCDIIIKPLDNVEIPFKQTFPLLPIF